VPKVWNVIEMLKDLDKNELMELKKAIEEELAKRSGNDWIAKLAKKVPYFAENPNKLKFVAENEKWVYFDVDATSGEMGRIARIVKSAGLPCFTQVRASIFVEGREIRVSRLLGVLKKKLIEM